MKHTYKFIVLFAVVFLSIGSFVSFVRADISIPGSGTPAPTPPATTPVSQPTAVTPLQNPLKNVSSIGDLVQKFVEIFSYIVVIIAVLALIYVGFQYVLYAAQGNSQKIKELHSWLLWIIVGTAIVIAARVMVLVVINTLEATGVVNQNVTNNARSAATGSR